MTASSVQRTTLARHGIAPLPCALDTGCSAGLEEEGAVGAEVAELVAQLEGVTGGAGEDEAALEDGEDLIGRPRGRGSIYWTADKGWVGQVTIAGRRIKRGRPDTRGRRRWS